MYMQESTDTEQKGSKNPQKQMSTKARSYPKLPNPGNFQLLLWQINTQDVGGRSLDLLSKKCMTTFSVTVNEDFYCTEWGNTCFALCLALSERKGGKKSFWDVTTSRCVTPKSHDFWFKKTNNLKERIQFKVVIIGSAFLTLNPTQKKKKNQRK